MDALNLKKRTPQFLSRVWIKAHNCVGVVGSKHQIVNNQPRYHIILGDQDLMLKRDEFEVIPKSKYVHRNGTIVRSLLPENMGARGMIVFHQLTPSCVTYGISYDNFNTEDMHGEKMTRVQDQGTFTVVSENTEVAQSTALRHVNFDGTSTKHKKQTMSTYTPLQFDSRPMYSHYHYLNQTRFNKQIKTEPMLIQGWKFSERSPQELAQFLKDQLSLVERTQQSHFMDFAAIESAAAKENRWRQNMISFLTDAYFYDRSQVSGHPFYTSFHNFQSNAVAGVHEYDALRHRNSLLQTQQLICECVLVQIYLFAQKTDVTLFQTWFHDVVSNFYTTLIDAYGGGKWTPFQKEILNVYNPEITNSALRKYSAQVVEQQDDNVMGQALLQAYGFGSQSHMENFDQVRGPSRGFMEVIQKQNPALFEDILNNRITREKITSHFYRINKNAHISKLPKLRGPSIERFIEKYNFGTTKIDADQIPRIPHLNENWIQSIRTWNLKLQYQVFKML